MIRLHKEGNKIITISIILFIAFNIINLYFVSSPYWQIILGFLIAVLVMVIQFFKNPSRPIDNDPNSVLCPADGTVVIMTKEIEKEFYKEEMQKISIFMSVTSVHLNRVPFKGKVVYKKYHAGEYLMAFYEKSSEKNENTAYAIESNDGKKIFLRQIAGFLARRIRPYVSENEEVEKGQELGFIRFGSRMDIYLPLNAKLNIKLGQKVFGNKTIIAYF